jgi:hypothetical protein
MGLPKLTQKLYSHPFNMVSIESHTAKALNYSLQVLFLSVDGTASFSSILQHYRVVWSQCIHYCQLCSVPDPLLDSDSSNSSPKCCARLLAKTLLWQRLLPIHFGTLYVLLLLHATLELPLSALSVLITTKMLYYPLIYSAWHLISELHTKSPLGKLSTRLPPKFTGS